MVLKLFGNECVTLQKIKKKLNERGKKVYFTLFFTLNVNYHPQSQGFPFIWVYHCVTYRLHRLTGKLHVSVNRTIVYQGKYRQTQTVCILDLCKCLVQMTFPDTAFPRM